MNSFQQRMQRAAFYLTFLAAASDLASIAVCHILIGAALVCLLLSRQPLRLPPVWLPLLLWCVGTLVSLAVSEHARGGFPQVKKFYVFVMLLIVYNAIRKLSDAYNLLWACAGVATAGALWSLAQFVDKQQEAEALRRSFYEYYIGNRITGFQSMWMTFSGLEMMAVLLTAALLFFGPRKKWTPGLWVDIGIMLAAIVLGLTRSVWGATAVGGAYLIAQWRPKLLLLTPLILIIAYFTSPDSVRERVESIYHPHGTMDSNQHRYITRVVGIEMIKAHPWFGVGPMRVGPDFNSYVPAWIPKPLPEGYYGHLHNIYIHYAAERGIPTMLMLMWFLGRMLFDFFRGLKRFASDPVRLAILQGCIAVVLAILVEGFFELNLGDSEVLGFFMVVTGIGYRAIEEPSRKEDRLPVQEQPLHA
jgi:O-antigen ligase